MVPICLENIFLLRLPMSFEDFASPPSSDILFPNLTLLLATSASLSSRKAPFGDWKLIALESEFFVVCATFICRGVKWLLNECLEYECAYIPSYSYTTIYLEYEKIVLRHYSSSLCPPFLLLLICLR